jgi:hypothetical protein
LDNHEEKPAQNPYPNLSPIFSNSIHAQNTNNPFIVQKKDIPEKKTPEFSGGKMDRVSQDEQLLEVTNREQQFALSNEQKRDIKQ